jgi:signal transduction histidine kinase
VSDFLEEVLSYVDLDEASQALLRDLHPKLAPYFPAVADRFYDAVWAHPGAAAVLTGPEQIERLRRTLIEWMSSGLLGPFDDKFHEKRSRIGRRHVQIGLKQQYMFTALSVVRTAYVEYIFKLYDGEQAQPVVCAVGKLLDMELALMLRHYQLDSEEKLVARERHSQSERLIAMRTLSAGLAHEVRNPLNAARLQLELLERRLRRQFGNDVKLVEPSELANHEIERLTALLDDFLAFARPPELHLHDQDVVEICRHVIELERPLADKRGVNLELQVPAQLVASIDAGRLHQVIQNLVRNGLEAAPRGGHVSLALHNGENSVHVRVRDDGPGIPDDVRSRIYEPFFSTKESGTGMGMAIVHSLVTLHGGTIDLTTDKSGTVFEITVPQRRAG